MCLRACGTKIWCRIELSGDVNLQEIHAVFNLSLNLGDDGVGNPIKMITEYFTSVCEVQMMLSELYGCT